MNNYSTDNINVMIFPSFSVSGTPLLPTTDLAACCYSPFLMLSFSFSSLSLFPVPSRTVVSIPFPPVIHPIRFLFRIVFKSTLILELLHYSLLNPFYFPPFSSIHKFQNHQSYHISLPCIARFGSMYQ